MEGVFITTFLISCNFSSDKIDLDGRLLFFRNTSKINRELLIATVTAAKYFTHAAMEKVWALMFFF